MQTSEYENIYKNEASHFFYVGNHNIILALIKKYFKIPRSRAKILDAGCGTGLLVRKLERFGKTWGIDISTEAVRLSKKRGIRVKRASVMNLPFKARTFDLITSVDVIYHKAIKDDRKVLREFFRVLKPGGLLTMRVPANRWLMRSCDKQVHTRERYDRKGLERKLKSCGFRVLKLSYVNLLLLLPAIVSMILEKMLSLHNTAHSSLTSLPTPVNNFIGRLLTLESHILKWANFPFGLGIIAVCKRP